MAEKLKGSLAFIICQFLVIYMLYYIDRSENSPIIFLYVFYFLGGCGIINFFSGRLTQKLGNTKTFWGRFLYAIATCFITFFSMLPFFKSFWLYMEYWRSVALRHIYHSFIINIGIFLR